MSEPLESFEHEERKVADLTGVQKKVLAQTRMNGLKRGVDWEYVATRVRYAKKGLEKLMAALGLSQATDVPDLAQKTVPEKKGAGVEGVVKRLFTNRHLVEVLLGDGRTVRVRVRDSKHFRLGLRVPVELRPGEELWSLTRKEPRFPGKW